MLDSRSTFTVNGAPVVLPAANIRVEEDRAEFFGTGTWRFSPVLVSELGARYEMSTLKQSGDSNLVKDLSFFKPRWLTTWNPADGHELRFLVERQVRPARFPQLCRHHLAQHQCRQCRQQEPGAGADLARCR